MEDANKFISELAEVEKKANNIIKDAEDEVKKRKELLSNKLSARKEEWELKISKEKEKLLKDYEERISKEISKIKSKWEKNVDNIKSTKVDKFLIKEMAKLLVE
jgi:vacuolar-type H+-ATPase subunit H